MNTITMVPSVALWVVRGRQQIMRFVVSEKKSGFFGALRSVIGSQKAPEVMAPPAAVDVVDLSEAAPPVVETAAEEAEAPEASVPQPAEATPEEKVAAEAIEPPAPTMRDKTIAFISGKGGVGRTSSVLSLAGAAAKRGKRVLIIDFDPQGSLTLATINGSPRYTIDELFAKTEITDVVTRVAWAKFAHLVDIAPASRDLVEFDNSDHPHQYELAFLRRFESLPDYDLVLVEAPPSLASLASIAVAVSGTTVVVAEPKLYSIRGAIEAVEFAEKVAAERELSTTVRVLVNKLNDAPESKFRHGELLRTFGEKVLATHIYQADAIDDANGAGVSVHAMPGSAARQTEAQYNALLDELLS